MEETDAATGSATPSVAPGPAKEEEEEDQVCKTLDCSLIIVLSWNFVTCPVTKKTSV